MKRGILEVSFELLYQLLNLADDVEVLDVGKLDRKWGTGVFHVLLGGDGLPYEVQEGSEAPIVSYFDVVNKEKA